MNVQNTDQAIISTAEIIEAEKKQLSLIFKEIQSEKTSQDLIRWIEDSQNHFHQTERYINSQKSIIEDDISKIVSNFGQQMLNERDKIFGRLDKFFEDYKKSFENFKKHYNDIFSLLLQYKYMGNPNNLSAKLSCEVSSESQQTYNSIKRSIKTAKNVNQK